MNILAPNEQRREGDFAITAMDRKAFTFNSEQQVFGYAMRRSVTIGDTHVPANRFFSRSLLHQTIFTAADRTLLVAVKNHKAHCFLSGEVDLEGPGFQKYMDGCTSTLLVCPIKYEAPCLNALYFPPNVRQTFHTHGHFRAGVVALGRGTAHVGMEDEEESIELKPGSIFLLHANERHRFVTEQQSMTIIAFHPVAEKFGPRDEENPMSLGTRLSEVTGTVP